jgi:hypothetical protein
MKFYLLLYINDLNAFVFIEFSKYFMSLTKTSREIWLNQA